MSRVKRYEENLADADRALLHSIEQALPILSDLSRSDLLLYLPAGPETVEIVAQARPHSIFPVYEEDLLHQRFDRAAVPWVFRALSTNQIRRGTQAGTVRNAPIRREVLPVIGSERTAIGALSIETNLLAFERHRRRSAPFRRALAQLQEMVLRGELKGTENLTPFGEHDGIVVVDLQRSVQYMSGIATNLFRHIGYQGSLLHRSVYTLETADAELVDEALSTGQCIERETPEHRHIWIRKAIPLYVPRNWLAVLRLRLVKQLPSPEGAVPAGVIITIHDATEARDKEQELKAKLAMIQEVHHRVKNNLQAIASLLRLEARRADSQSVRHSLEEAVNRIMSVAVVHEFLSYHSDRVINLHDIAQRIIGQMAQSTVDPNKDIKFKLVGPTVHLSSQQATACALVINELLQNAVEHGYEGLSSGVVTVSLAELDDAIRIEVMDDGNPLPPNFSLEQNSGLGLRIVQRLVEGDLKGSLELSGDEMVRAVVTFPKTFLGGETIGA